MNDLETQPQLFQLFYFLYAGGDVKITKIVRLS